MTTLAVRTAPRMPRETALFSVFALTAIVWFGFGLAAPPLGVQVVVLGLLVAVLGLPHGALDPLIARRLGLWSTPLGFAGFNLAYIGVVAAVVGLWLVLPLLSLVAFLLVSAAHFGSDWNASRPLWMRLATGMALLSLPALGHRAEVSVLYEILAPGAAAVADVQAFIAPALLLGMLGAAVIAFRARPHETVEIMLAAGLALVAPPLVFFAIYFCALHSARHLREGFAAERGGGRFAATIAVVYTVVPIAAAGLFVWGLSAGASLDAAITQLIFIGLAGLTVPHMALVALDERFARRAAGHGIFDR